MASLQSEGEVLHFVLIPLMCPGHLIPMVDIARLVAQHGVTVTIVTTPANAARIESPVSRAVNSGLPIRIAEVKFPAAEFGLPDGCENVDALPSIDLMRNFFFATKELQHPTVDLIKEMKPSPSCIVSDRTLSWTGDVARSLGIPRILFDGMSCFSLLIIHNLYLHKTYETVSDSSEPFLVPGMPRRTEFTREQLPGMFNPSSNVKMNDIRADIRRAEKEAYGVVINTYEELEPEFVMAYKKAMKDKVWCIGPVSLCNRSTVDRSQRGNKRAAVDETVLMNWLDTHPPGSVIYCCLGSLNRVTFLQMRELGLALESSRNPFLWVIRGANQGPELEMWLEQDGFEERVKERCLIIRGWAPQVLILSHPSVGGFLTHCGWNSTLEGLAAGVPMVTWPIFAEQFFNEKLVVEVLGVGEAVGAKVVVHLGEEEKDGVRIVRREEIRVAVEKVMDGGEEGEERRNRGKVFKDMAEKAVLEGGSAYIDVIAMIEDIRKNVHVLRKK